MSRIERKKRAQKLAIIQTAVDMLGERTFDEITMERIAETADISRGTLYNYFPNKEAILAEYVRMSLTKENDRRIASILALENTRSRVRYLLETLVRSVQHRKDVFEPFLVHQMRQMANLSPNAAQPSGVATPIDEIIRLGVLSEEIRNDLDAQYIRELFLFVFVQLVKELYACEGAEPVAFLHQSVSLFMNAVSPTPPEHPSGG